MTRDFQFEVQTRDGDGTLEYFDTIEGAEAHARMNPSVWKISFTVRDTGERVRLVKSNGDWIYDPIRIPHD